MRYRRWQARSLNRQLNREIDRAIYLDWMKSLGWKNLVSRLKAERGYKCQKCGNDKDLQGHHLNYHWIMTPYEERTVEILCRPCHQIIHGFA